MNNANVSQSKEKDARVTIHYADYCQNPKNCLYPHEGTVADAEEFARIVAHDHVFFDFRDNYRNLDNFIGTSVLAVDCDNDHSEQPEEWISLRRMTEIFASVRFVAYTSRNHEKPKGSKAARPRFHMVFPIERITSADEYKQLGEQLQRYLPVFDENAMDAGRFYFGNPEAKVYFHDGDLSITDFLEEAALWNSTIGDSAKEPQPATTDKPKKPLLSLEAINARSDFGDDTIPEGSRNATLSTIAGKLVKRYGVTDTALDAFMKNADRCSPPLSGKELDAIWQSAKKFYEKLSADESYISPEEYEKQLEQSKEPRWEQPIPFDEPNLPEFPIDCLPDSVRGFVTELSESTQTPVDICASSALAILALCVQGKYRIQGKPDWIEPLNLYVVGIAEPSERKSAIISAVSRPVCTYEAEENKRLAPLIEKSKMELRILQQKQKAMEQKAIKGEVKSDELLEIADEIASFEEKKPLRLYVDDITTEKLVSALSDSGRTAVLSSEGGLFDLLAGIYSKNVNIDVILKAWSGDSIRVDRIGRASESIPHPALTILLTVQPKVIAGMMANRNFSGRGLTARFLYCMPKSHVGNRRFNTKPICEEALHRYEGIVTDMLDEYKPEPDLITLTDDARELLGGFAEALEPKLKTDYADISQWAGKLTGTVLRIAGILCRAQGLRADDFLQEPDPLIVDTDTMQKAITIGSYYMQHARAAYALMGADETTENSKYLLSMVLRHEVTRFTRRDVMRLCQRFKNTAQVQPALDHLEDLGYIAAQEEQISGRGRRAGCIYLVNPLLVENDNTAEPASA